MPTRSILWAGLFGAAIVATGPGCKKATSPPTVASADAEPVAKPKPKPKPKCEDLSEKCAASADTQAKIAHADSVFIPPEGWFYAQQGEMTLATPSGHPGAMAITAYEAGGKEEAKARDEQYQSLVKALQITLPEKAKKKYTPKWEKSDATRKTGNTEILLWQAEAAKRDGKNGFLLVLLTSDPAGKKILGVAFAPEGDDKTVEAISKSLETIGPGSYQ